MDNLIELSKAIPALLAKYPDMYAKHLATATRIEAMYLAKASKPKQGKRERIERDHKIIQDAIAGQMRELGIKPQGGIK